MLRAYSLQCIQKSLKWPKSWGEGGKTGVDEREGKGKWRGEREGKERGGMRMEM